MILPEQLRILIVEDNPADVLILRDALSERPDAECGIVHVERLADAQEQLRQRSFDVVLLDLGLPDSQGIATFMNLHRHTPGVAVLVLTGLNDESVGVKAVQNGAQDYLLKGNVHPANLGSIIRFAIERQRLTTLLERKNRRLAKLYRTANEFVENVSHEFRTPLTVIKEYAALVKDGVVGPVTSEQKNMLSIIENRVDDLTTMVEDMLDISALEAGLMGINRKNCQVGEILAGVWPGLERRAAIKGVQLDSDVDPLLPDVFCDPEKAGRVLINLITNAIKFCGQPGHVWLNCYRELDGAGVKLSVSDNGSGISAENQRAIFRRFKQLGEPVRSSTKGFGLGLSIAKELVALNLGDITVESQAGQGSTFSFTLPPADPPEVIRRYLKRIERLHIGSTHLSLVQADVDESASAMLADDANALLSGLLRSRDLLFRVGLARWVVVLPVAESEFATFRERVENAVIAANPNRLGEPLPDIRWKFLGAWRGADDQEEILERLATARGIAETVYA